MIRKPLFLSGILGAAVLAAALVATSAPAVAQTVTITDQPSDELLFAAPEDRIILSGTFTDSPNVTEVSQVPANNSPAAEQTWLGTLGLTGLTFISRDEPPVPVTGNLLGGTFTGPAGWIYAVVKPDNVWTVYKNTGDAITLITDLFSHEISHISWYVPLPAAAWLFLSALAGLLGWKRWFGGGQPAAA